MVLPAESIHSSDCARHLHGLAVTRLDGLTAAGCLAAHVREADLQRDSAASDEPKHDERAEGEIFILVVREVDAPTAPAVRRQSPRHVKAIMRPAQSPTTCSMKSRERYRNAHVLRQGSLPRKHTPDRCEAAEATREHSWSRSPYRATRSVARTVLHRLRWPRVRRSRWTSLQLWRLRRLRWLRRQLWIHDVRWRRWTNLGDFHVP